MSVVALDRTVPEIDTDAVAGSADAAGPVTWRPRPAAGSWWQTRQHRNELTERLLALFTVPSEDRTRDKTRRRGLTKLLVSPELAEVLTAIIFRVRGGRAALPLVSADDVFEQTWSPPLPFLFQRRYGTEDRPLTRAPVL